MSYLRTIIRKAAVIVGARRSINFIEGSNVTITVTDDSANDRVDVTIASAGGAGGESLAATLAIGNTTNEQNIYSNNSKSRVGIFDNGAALDYQDALIASSFLANATNATQSFTDGTDSGGVDTNALATAISHTQLIELTAPNVNLASETASLILSTDASKNIKGLATSTYPSLTELAYVKGVTSDIQTQINSKQATLVSATNIKTINGSSVLGAGDLVVSGALPDVVITKYAPALDQTITAGYSAYYSGYYEIADTKFLEIGDGSTFEIG